MNQHEELHRKFIDVLHQSDVGRYIELPQISVMGDTSSGKSSLLSAISGVEFPANDKITTRCPLRLRMEKCREGRPVRAQVGIKWHSLTSNKPDYPSKVLAKMSDIPAAITDAQLFVFNNAGKDVQADVCFDIIEIEVSGPDCVDLTLIDLPGIVRSIACGESATLVDDIKSIIDEFLRNERCVILAIVPANVDFHNSQIMVY